MEFERPSKEGLDNSPFQFCLLRMGLISLLSPIEVMIRASKVGLKLYKIMKIAMKSIYKKSNSNVNLRY
jgi:hypothetical protein